MILKNLFLLLKILLPPSICFLMNYFGDGYNHFEIVIIPFALLIVLPNISKAKYNIFLTIILSLILSSITFFASIYIYLGIGYPLEYLFNLYNLSTNVMEIIFNILSIVTFNIISPLLVLFWYKKLFFLDKNKFTKYVLYSTFLTITIALLIIKAKSSLVIAIWQFIMVLSIQLMTYQQELKYLINYKKKSYVKKIK